MLLGTLDTKHAEYAFVQERLTRAGIETVLVDVGVVGEPSARPDITAAEVAAAGGGDLAALRTARDRGAALAVMAEGAAAVARRLHGSGELSGVLALGGSGGSSIAAAAMRAVPIGLPKLLVSTMAAGDVSGYVGTSDVTIMHSVVDLAGLNRLSRTVLENAAGAMAGMAAAYRERSAARGGPSDRPLVAASMFGVTTPAVDTARRRLEDLGYEVLVFHATGSGGRTMESLIAGGHVAGVLDLTTTELADEVVGGVLSAGPERLDAAAGRGVPQVVSFGALDMVNFGPEASVPSRFADRKLLVHNADVTLMRTSASEAARIGDLLGRKLAAATGPVSLRVPRGGFSAVDAEGGPFWDPGADEACVGAALARLDGTPVEVATSGHNINDEDFALAAADELHRLVTGAGDHREDDA
ncbi:MULTISPECIES: Tm-1-like ATP-binding domain-containing protein [Actinomadura]|uniref:Tm-1-like ATP-binding domain-containing protein n=1 Tax=Actinomadura yumaensis TaxID=111807 RepID=A0ABW2CFU8_9ACTN|nr:Tm-1-like ATP-binding domain-containing protein [Actinomadura sp. J1-007]MWK35597.1 UPF0261 family protein [Actinomadura sp. J1-007]